MAQAKSQMAPAQAAPQEAAAGEADGVDRQADRGRAFTPARTWMRSPRSCRRTRSRMPRAMAQLDGVAKKNGFASFDEYSDVTDNIGMVMAGFDPATKKYVGNEAVHQGADRRGPGRQENVRQGQEGSAGGSQRGVEESGAGDPEQGQHRSGRPNTTTSSPLSMGGAINKPSKIRPAVALVASEAPSRVKKTGYEILSLGFDLSRGASENP